MAPALTDAQLDRYARHIILEDVGGAGQKKLLGAKVLVVGAGGLGAPAILYLAGAGLGTIGIVDDDAVDLSNLQRQVIFKTRDLGQPKARAAAAAALDLNPDLNVVPIEQRLDAENAPAIIADYDLVLDGCDNFQTRLRVNDACHALSKPLVSAAVGKFDGQLSVFTSHDGESPCYRCLVPEVPQENGGTCADDGIIGALTGVIGSWAALEVIKLVTGAGTPLIGKLMIFDGLTGASRVVKLRKDSACATCGSGT